ncbi:RNA polymerase sigma factor [Flavobacterium sp.]|uniref:RNA polymerase sigma factor n=1 Tax=Flavobacterium sp. TaxID=239 RepID=UPI0022C4EC2E|nr:sigma-70 family RNA polymerase sigma factor [Flavobacterium sp.]MCZ8144568.1 sigma-70 family RNA polymerase sigma factor [Flavobacterium sp.]MCZ8366212.1 sigma-70 family RNA polymerase sigma factor [Flavobacterium sp.]
MDEKLIEGCRKKQREAQRQVYEKLGPYLYRLCKRYLKKEEEIEEVLADSFFILFTKIDQLNENKAFWSWAKRITINESLRHLKKKVNFNLYLEDRPQIPGVAAEQEQPLLEADLLKLLDTLPHGSRTIFSLFVIEGYSHKEISTLLSITEGTSKSQLNFAKSKLKELVNLHYYQQAK